MLLLCIALLMGRDPEPSTALQYWEWLRDHPRPEEPMEWPEGVA